MKTLNRKRSRFTILHYGLYCAIVLGAISLLMLRGREGSYHNPRKLDSGTSQAKPRVSIATILDPQTTDTFTSVVNSPLATQLLSSLNRSITEEEWKMYDIVLFVGFDSNNELWSSKGAIDALLKMFPRIPIVPVSFPSRGGLHPLNNEMLVELVQQGAEYIVQAKASLTVWGSGWLGSSIEKLRSGYPQNTGVVLSHSSKLALSIVHRQHFEVFKYFAPTILTEEDAYEWLQQVYGDEMLFQLPDFRVSVEEQVSKGLVKCDRGLFNRLVSAGKNILRQKQLQNES